MLNVIIPLDFSHTSFNAAHYAANMYKGRTDVTLILYHFYTHGEDTETAGNKDFWEFDVRNLGRIQFNRFESSVCFKKNSFPIITPFF